MEGLYVEGMTLVLAVDWAGHHGLSHHSQIPMTIRTVYQPFTMSPVMEVVFITESGDQVEAILKLFDRRFGEDFRCGSDKWTQQAEAAWQDYVCHGKAPSLFHRLEEKELKESAGIFEDSSSSDGSPTKASMPRSFKATKERLAQAEGKLQRAALQDFATEVMAYQKMSALQGRCVPSIFAHVSTSLAPPGLDRDRRGYFKIPGILLQHISGFNLSTELTHKVARGAWQDVVQRAVDAARMINNCGVLNLDCQPRNVVVELSTLQPYLVDFAQCTFRDHYKNEDEFAYYANSTDNQGAIGAVMARKLKKEKGVVLKMRYKKMACNFDPDE